MLGNLLALCALIVFWTVVTALAGLAGVFAWAVADYLGVLPGCILRRDRPPVRRAAAKEGVRA